MAVIVLVNSFQFIHLRVKLTEDSDWVFITGVYGSPRVSVRKKLWDDLRLIAQYITSPWLLTGDFNAMLNEGEKRGGSRLSPGSCHLFQSFCSDCMLRDLGFQGLEFTWNRGSLIERLDRALCNSQWETYAPATTVYHLHKLKSDHRPLAICLGGNKPSSVPHPFRFLSAWLSHTDFACLVKDNWVSATYLEETVQNFVLAAKTWNVETFGHILKKKRVLIARLKGI